MYILNEVEIEALTFSLANRTPRSNGHVSVAVQMHADSLVRMDRLVFKGGWGSPTFSGSLGRLTACAHPRRSEARRRVWAQGAHGARLCPQCANAPDGGPRGREAGGRGAGRTAGSPRGLCPWLAHTAAFSPPSSCGLPSGTPSPCGLCVLIASSCKDPSYTASGTALKTWVYLNHPLGAHPPMWSHSEKRGVRASTQALGGGAVQPRRA